MFNVQAIKKIYGLVESTVTLLTTVVTMVVSFSIGLSYHVVQIAIFRQIFFVYVLFSYVWNIKSISEKNKHNLTYIFNWNSSLRLVTSQYSGFIHIIQPLYRALNDKIWYISVTKITA